MQFFPHEGFLSTKVMLSMGQTFMHVPHPVQLLSETKAREPHPPCLLTYIIKLASFGTARTNSPLNIMWAKVLVVSIFPGCRAVTSAFSCSSFAFHFLSIFLLLLVVICSVIIPLFGMFNTNPA